MPNMHMRTIRGPAAYAAGGFTYAVDEVEYIGESSGRMVAALTVSSSPMIAQVVNHSGNIATIILRDTRSGGIEPTSGDFSGLHIGVVYTGEF